jgi:hypothetical protein
MSTTKFEVQTLTICDGWINTWTSDDEPQYFETEAEAFHAIGEFFEDLARANMAEDYDVEDYRVVEITVST